MKVTIETIREKTWNLCKEYDARNNRRTKVLLSNFITISLEKIFGEEIENFFRSDWQTEVNLFCQKYKYADKDQLADAEHIEHDIRSREYLHDCPDCRRERSRQRSEQVSVIMSKEHFDKFAKALLTVPTPPGTFVTLDGALDWLSHYRMWFNGERREAVPSVSSEKIDA